MDKGQFRRYIQAFKDNFISLREQCAADLLPAAVVHRTLRESGGPADPEDLQAPLEEFSKRTAARPLSP